MINYKEADGQSLIHLINMIQNDELIGAEIGMWTAQTFCTLLDNCPRIKTLYGVDPYKPYVDIIWGEDNSMIVDEDKINHIRILALSNIMATGKQDKVLFIEDTSENAVDLIKDEELDFIFVDSYLNQKQATEELYRWYNKVKSGGLFCGHDFDAIKDVVEDFRLHNNIKGYMSVFDQTFVWIKE
jgi:hypothetical protein